MSNQTFKLTLRLHKVGWIQKGDKIILSDKSLRCIYNCFVKQFGLKRTVARDLIKNMGLASANKKFLYHDKAALKQFRKTLIDPVRNREKEFVLNDQDPNGVIKITFSGSLSVKYIWKLTTLVLKLLPDKKEGNAAKSILSKVNLELPDSVFVHRELDAFDQLKSTVQDFLNNIVNAVGYPPPYYVLYYMLENFLPDAHRVRFLTTLLKTDSETAHSKMWKAICSIDSAIAKRRHDSKVIEDNGPSLIICSTCTFPCALLHVGGRFALLEKPKIYTKHLASGSEKQNAYVRVKTYIKKNETQRVAYTTFCESKVSTFLWHIHYLSEGFFDSVKNADVNVISPKNRYLDLNAKIIEIKVK